MFNKTRESIKYVPSEPTSKESSQGNPGETPK